MNKSLFIVPALAVVLVACTPADETATDETTGTGTLDTTAPTTTDSTAQQESTTDDVTEQQVGTIVEVAGEAGNFETLVAAVQAAGLAEALSGEGPFTVFAPTDEAFAALPEGTLEDLLANPDELAAILQYHVVSGEVMAADVVELQEATTLEGSTVDIHSADEGVTLNGEVNVVQTDIPASNGVIHVIDGVLLPE